jgi:hypothetical protein
MEMKKNPSEVFLKPPMYEGAGPVVNVPQKTRFPIKLAGIEKPHDDEDDENIIKSIN